MEEVRRDLMKRFGEKAEDGPNSVYAGGLWVRTSMVPYMQDAAAEALREGLAKFDGGRGWRDLGLSVDVDGDWRGAARPRAGRHRLSRLAQGGGAVEERRAGARSASPTARPGRCRLRPRSSPSAASAARPSAISGRA